MPSEARALARCVSAHYGHHLVTTSYVQGDAWLVLETPGDWPVVQTCLRLSHLDEHGDAALAVAQRSA